MNEIKTGSAKRITYTFRPSTTIVEGIALYLQTIEGSTRTQALEDLLELGITAWLKHYYDVRNMIK